jgi:tetratricopeptide (TPR) repeat protein
MGLAYTGLGKFKKAIEAYEKAIEINPYYGTAYYNMGIAYTGLGKFKKAIEAYEKAIEINPDYGTAYYNMGIAYTGLDKFEEAISKPHIVISPIFIRINLNGFFIGFNCLFKLI